jgi:YD repeat-containing protein
VSLALVSLALAGDPVLGPRGWTWLGPLPPDAAAGRDAVTFSPRDCALVVRRTDLDGGPANRDVRLSRVWADGAWAWADDWRVAAGFLYRPGESPARLQGDGLPGLSVRVDSAGRVVERVADGRAVAILRGSDGAFLGMSSGAVSVRVEGDRGVASDGRSIRWDRSSDGLAKVDAGAAGATTYSYTRGVLSGITWTDGASLRVGATAGGGTRVSWAGDEWRCEVLSPERLRVDSPDGAWLVERSGDLFSVTDPGGHATRTRLRDGRLAGWIDPRGGETRLGRDAEGRLTRVEAPGGQTWAFAWAGNALGRVTAPDGAEWTLSRGERGALTAVVDPAARTTSVLRTAEGRPREVSIGSARWTLLRDAAGRVSTVADPTGARVDLLRGSTGLVERVRDPSGGAWGVGRDTVGAVVRVEDPGGGTWLITRDGLGRATAVTDPAGAETTVTRGTDGRIERAVVAGKIWTFSWSPAGALVGVRDPAAHNTSFERDGRGAATRVRRADGSEVTLARDAAGDLLAADGVRVHRDPAGRPLGVDGWTGGATLRWDRDVAGRVVGVSGNGLSLSLARDPAGAVRLVRIGEGTETRLERDAAGRVVRVAEDTELRIDRDAAGRVVGLCGAGPTDLRISRDVRGLVSRLVASTRAGELAWSWGRDAAGRILKVDAGPDTRLGVDRDSAGRPTLARLRAALTRIEYGTDTALTVLDERDTVRLRLDWRLDPAGRLARALFGMRYLLRRDPLGILAAAESDGAAWSQAPDRVDGVDGAFVRYVAGRPIEAGGRPGKGTWGLDGPLRLIPGNGGEITRIEGRQGAISLSYDGIGRLVGWSGPAGRVEVARDPLGRLTAPVGWVTPLELGEPVAAVEGVAVTGRSTGVLLGPAAVPVARVDATGGELRVDALPWAPHGVDASLLGQALVGPGGRYAAPSGPWIGLLEAIEPTSGAPIGPQLALPWAPRRWELGPADSPWPEPDGAAAPAWDDAGWASRAPWGDPLAVLVAAGELPGGGPRADRAPGLPWLPASFAPLPPAPVPDPLAWVTAGAAIDEDPLIAWIVSLALAPTHAPDPTDVAALLFGAPLAQALDLPPELAPALPPELSRPRDPRAR